MKKIILLLTVAISLLSCSKNNQQLEVVKSDLKKKDVSEQELSMFSFNTTEILGKDAVDAKIKKFNLSYRNLLDFGNKSGNKKTIEAAVNYLDSVKLALKDYENLKDVKFYKVDAYRLSANDTVALSRYYLTDKNKIYNLEYIR
jgi:hypothetical protein